MNRLDLRGVFLFALLAIFWLCLKRSAVAQPNSFGLDALAKRLKTSMGDDETRRIVL